MSYMCTLFTVKPQFVNSELHHCCVYNNHMVIDSLCMYRDIVYNTSVMCLFQHTSTLSNYMHLTQFCYKLNFNQAFWLPFNGYMGSVSISDYIMIHNTT